MNVYVIQEFPSQFIKIGKSTNPEQRLLELRTGNPHLLELIGYIKFESDSQALKAESCLHQHFKSVRVRNEWFKIIGHTSNLLQEMATITACGQVVYHKRLFYTIPQDLFWYIPKLKMLDLTPSNLRFYKRQMNTYRKLYDRVKQHGSAEDLEYVKTFHPLIREPNIEVKPEIRTKRKNLKQRNPKRYAELFGHEKEQPRKSSKELFAEFVGQGS